MSSPTLLCRPFTMSDDHHTSDNMIFDMDIGQSMPLQWDPHYPDQKAPFAFDTAPTSYEYGPTDSASYYDPSTVYNPASDLSKQSPSLDDNLYLSSWINESELSGLPSPSSPISIPSPLDPQLSSASSFSAFSDQTAFSPPEQTVFSPAAFAALHPLPASVSPPSSFEDVHPLRQRINSMSQAKPTWASNLWDAAPTSLRTPSVMRPSIRHSPLSDATTIRQRPGARRGSHSSSFLSTSAPSIVDPHAPSMSRTVSRRSESVMSDDRDATIRKKKRSPAAEDNPSSFEKPAADIRMYRIT